MYVHTYTHDITPCTHDQQTNNSHTLTYLRTYASHTHTRTCTPQSSTHLHKLHDQQRIESTPVLRTGQSRAHHRDDVGMPQFRQHSHLMHKVPDHLSAQRLPFAKRATLQSPSERPRYATYCEGQAAAAARAPFP